MVRRLAATAMGVALFGVLAGAAAAALSPVGLWTAENGRTWEALYVYRDGAVVSRYRTTLGPAVKGRMYAYRLDATPASFRGTFRFCIQSHDAAGNVSKPSCAKVRVR